MPPEFFEQNICGACEGEGTNLVGATCRFCGGTGGPAVPQPEYEPPPMPTTNAPDANHSSDNKENA